MGAPGRYSRPQAISAFAFAFKPPFGVHQTAKLWIGGHPFEAWGGGLLSGQSVIRSKPHNPAHEIAADTRHYAVPSEKNIVQTGG
jgi:hypothetical protein